MSKAFTKESEVEEDDDLEPAEALPAGTKNYLTPAGHARLVEELTHLRKVERPAVVQTVTWAAGNGDRSENGDYIYGKRRLREIDRRLRFLAKRLDLAEVVDPARQRKHDQVFFGATVTYADRAGAEHTISIVGVDETGFGPNRISWVAPVARALLKARVGDVIQVRTPGGTEAVDVLAISYAPPPETPAG